MLRKLSLMCKNGFLIKKHVLLEIKCFFLMAACSYHVTYGFQSGSTLYICLNVKELLARNRCNIWSLSNCNGTRTHNHLGRKWTLNRLAKLAQSFYLWTKWLWVWVPLQSLYSWFSVEILRNSLHQENNTS